MSELTSQILQSLLRSIERPQLIQLTADQLRPAVLAKLQIGQLLQATTLGESRGGQVQIQLGGTELTARTPLQLAANQALQLLVTKTGATPELKLVTPPSTSELQSQGLRDALPRQAPLARLFATLSAGLSVAQNLRLDAATQQLIRDLLSRLPTPEKLQDAAQLKQSVRNSGLFHEAQLARGNAPAGDMKGGLSRLSAALRQGLAQAQNTAGSQSTGQAGRALAGNPPPVQGAERAAPANTEAALKALSNPAAPTTRPGAPAGSTGPLSGTTSSSAASLAGAQLPLPRGAALPDGLQANVGRVGAEANPQQQVLARIELQQQLLRQVESGIARIHTRQLASVPTDDSGRLLWQLELPVRNGDQVDDFVLRIERDEETGETRGGAAGWVVTLHFTLADSGPVHARLRLQGEQVSTHFWAERGKTLQRIDGHLDRLSRALQSAGLEVVHLTASGGKPPDSVELPRPSHNLLDEQA